MSAPSLTCLLIENLRGAVTPFNCSSGARHKVSVLYDHGAYRKKF